METNSSNSFLMQINENLKKLTDFFVSKDLDEDSKLKFFVNKGYSNSEIAELFGVPKGTIDSRRAKLKKNKSKGVKK